MTSLSKNILPALVSSIVFFVSPSIAQETYLVTEGAPPINVDVQNGSRVFVPAESNTSFCCTINPYVANVDSAKFSTFINFIGENPPTPVARGIESPVASGAVGADTRKRYCWIERDGTFTSNRGFGISDIADGDTVTASLSCEETSVAGTYNTSVSEFNFLELSGRGRFLDGNSNINVELLITSAITGETISQSFSIAFDRAPANKRKRVDIAIHDLLDGADFGQIIIKHDGTPNQLSARISYYDVTSTSPLDFTLVGQEAFK